MARYALEPIPDPAVDDALREALGKLKGRRWSASSAASACGATSKAVDLLCKRLKDQRRGCGAGRRSCPGQPGHGRAVKALEDALAEAPAANRQAFYEGLFRCAEALSAHGSRAAALAIYDRLNQPQVAAARFVTGRRARPASCRQEERDRRI